MQKWEYLTLTAAYAGNDDLGMVKTVNNVVRKEWKKETWSIADALQQMGEQGWELVGVMTRVTSAGTSPSADPVYYFKRPKE